MAPNQPSRAAIIRHSRTLSAQRRRKGHPFSSGTDCPAPVFKAAELLFDAARGGMLPKEVRRAGAFSFGRSQEWRLRAYDDALDFVAGRRDAERRTVALDGIYRVEAPMSY